MLSLGVPVGAVLEGGYDLDALAGSTLATMEALVEGGDPGDHPARGDRHARGRGAAPLVAGLTQPEPVGTTCWT